jgi:hypothetical protein
MEKASIKKEKENAKNLMKKKKTKDKEAPKNPLNAYMCFYREK